MFMTYQLTIIGKTSNAAIPAMSKLRAEPD